MLTVGFSYDLRDDYLALGFSAEGAAEFDSIETINSITLALETYGCKVEKLVTSRRWRQNW